MFMIQQQKKKKKILWKYVTTYSKLIVTQILPKVSKDPLFVVYTESVYLLWMKETCKEKHNSWKLIRNLTADTYFGRIDSHTNPARILVTARPIVNISALDCELLHKNLVHTEYLDIKSREWKNEQFHLGPLCLNEYIRTVYLYYDTYELNA